MYLTSYLRSISNMTIVPSTLLHVVLCSFYCALRCFSLPLFLSFVIRANIFFYFLLYNYLTYNVCTKHFSSINTLARPGKLSCEHTKDLIVRNDTNKRFVCVRFCFFLERVLYLILYCRYKKKSCKYLP